MKKSIVGVLLAALMLVATSGLSRSNGGIDPGTMAPDIVLDNDTLKTSLQDMRGEYVLLTFWASDDAESRIQCTQYSAWVREHEIDNLNHISVNFDLEPELFREIARLDNLDPQRQFNVRGAQADAIINDYGLASGYGSVLIGPDGRIVSVNPTTSDIPSLI